MDKQLIRQQIRDWVKLEEESVTLKQRIKQINQVKKDISAKLLVVMKEHELDEFDLNQEGKLVRQVKKTKQCISKKTLLTTLSHYYKSEAEAKKTTEFILNARIEKLSESLCKK
jgi:predicted RND superfamily exporter protein